jgi:hypothetical protein
MKTDISAILLIALAIYPARAEHNQGCGRQTISVPDSLGLVCSATWQFQGTCIAADMWDKWVVTGRTNPQDSFVRPFESVPIAVIGYELVKLHEGDKDRERNDRASWFMVGSAIYSQPDAMIWLGPGETRVRQMWPSGMGQLWPSKDKPNPSGDPDRIDLHGLCFGGSQITILLTIYYSPQSK